MRQANLWAFRKPTTRMLQTEMSRDPRFAAFRPRQVHEIGGCATFQTQSNGVIQALLCKVPGHELARNRSRDPILEKCRATPDPVHLGDAKCMRSGVARTLAPTSTNKTVP